MPTLYDPARRQELLDRLGRLTHDRPARWGRFNAPRMVAHLREAMRLATGELVVAPRPFPLKIVLRQLAIHILPFPKGAPTAPELLAREPAEWRSDVAALAAAIERVREPAPGAVLPDHPIFGRMRAQDWGVLLYRHVDHHFRQFGI